MDEVRRNNRLLELAYDEVLQYRRERWVRPKWWRRYDSWLLSHWNYLAEGFLTAGYVVVRIVREIAYPSNYEEELGKLRTELFVTNEKYVPVFVLSTIQVIIIVYTDAKF